MTKQEKANAVVAAMAEATLPRRLSWCDVCERDESAFIYNDRTLRCTGCRVWRIYHRHWADRYDPDIDFTANWKHYFPKSRVISSTGVKERLRRAD